MTPAVLANYRENIRPQLLYLCRQLPRDPTERSELLYYLAAEIHLQMRRLLDAAPFPQLH